MKKRFLVLCLMLVLIPVLTGCFRLDTTMKVNSNGTVDIRTLVAVSNELTSMGDGDSSVGLTEEEINEYKAKGFEYEEYTDAESGYTGYTLTKKGVDIKSVQSGGEGLDTMMSGDIFQVNGNRVTVDFAAFSEEEYEESSTFVAQLGTYGGYMRFNLEIPGKAIRHNATSVSKDGRTLTWDLTAMKATDRIHAEFDLNPGMPGWVIPVIIGMLAAAAIAAAVILILKKKKAAVPEAVEEIREAVEETVEEAPEIVPEDAQADAGDE